MEITLPTRSDAFIAVAGAIHHLEGKIQRLVLDKTRSVLVTNTPDEARWLRSHDLYKLEVASWEMPPEVEKIIRGVLASLRESLRE